MNISATSYQNETPRVGDLKKDSGTAAGDRNAEKPHTEMRGAAMSLTAAVSGFVVFLLSVSVVQGQNGWGVTYTDTQICAFKGSTVNMSCTYTYPSRGNDRDAEVSRTFWFTKEKNEEAVDLRTDSEYAGRVQDHCDKNSCSLTITHLRVEDSAQYKCRFITNQPGGNFTGSPGVTLSVTDLQVKRSSSSGSTTLTCHSRCLLPDHPSYIWYKNGQQIQEESSSHQVTSNYADSYSCAVKGHEHHPSPSECVSGQFCSKVNYNDRSICAVRGSSVDISCSYISYNSYYEPITSMFWFRSERHQQQQQIPSQPEDISEDSQYAGRVQVFKTPTGRSTLRISDLRDTDSAQYRFKFITQSFEWGSSLSGTTLTVTDPNLQVLVTRLTHYKSGPWAELECHSICRHSSSFIWYKNGQEIQHETYSTYEGYCHFADSFSCSLTGFEHHPAPSVCVSGQSCSKVNYDDRSICVPRGSSVDISCSYNSYYEPITSMFWFRSERHQQQQIPSQPEDISKDSQYAGRVQIIQTPTGRSTLRISDLRDTDSAQYRFRFITQSFEWGSSLSGTTLTVTALQVQVNTITVHQSDTEAELECVSSCSPAGSFSYVWFKNGEKVVKEETSLYSGRFNPGDDISCALKGHEDYRSPSVYGPRPPSVSVSPSGEIVEGSSVNLTCSSDANPAANYTWYKENEDSPKASGQTFTITDFTPEHSGNYYCEAQNIRGRHNSTLYLLTVGTGKSVFVMNISRLIVVVLMPILQLLLILCRRRTLCSTTDQNKPAETIELDSFLVNETFSDLQVVAAAQTEDTEDYDDLE